MLGVMVRMMALGESIENADAGNQVRAMHMSAESTPYLRSGVQRVERQVEYGRVRASKYTHGSY